MIPNEAFQEILNNPAKLGEFLRDAAEIAVMEKVARKQAINISLRGTKVPGWILRRQENKFVLPMALEPLVKESLSAVLEYFGTISERRYLSLCSRCGVIPDPSSIIKAGTTVVLAQSNQQK